MCGILGYINYQIPPEKFIRGLDQLQRRGPDDQGLWSQGDIGLGHRRLSIIDLSEHGRQPMFNEDETILVVANGEIYNFRKLRDQLQAAGHSFSSDSDSEVLVHGYEEWGLEGLLPKLNGMFAFTLYDLRKEKLMIARDRMGIKPLYYWHQEGSLAFGSELRALKTILPQNPEISTSARDSYFTFGYIGGEESIYDKCHKLLPGSYAVFDKKLGDLEKNFYWTAPTPNTSSVSRYSKEQIHELLRCSVKERLVADRPLCTFLSGGIDSSLITGIASSLKSDLKTFAIGFEFANYDESKHARQVANYLGTDHREMVCTEQDALNVIPKLASIYQEPYADSSAIPTYLLCEMARKDAVVALSGDGGDELCLGYEHYQKTNMFNALRKIPCNYLISSFGEKIFRTQSKLGKLSRALGAQSRAESLLISRGFFHRLFFPSLLKHDYVVNETYYSELFDKMKNIDEAQAWAWVEMQHYLPEDILTKVDRVSMYNSLEVRVPLLSHKVVEACMSVSKKDKLCNGQSKYILREILADYVPRKLWERPKQGFSMPIAEWLRTSLNDMLHDYLSPKRMTDEFNKKHIQLLIKEHEMETKDNSSYLWSLLMWERWIEYNRESVLS